MNAKEIFNNQKTNKKDQGQQRAVGDYGMTAAATKEAAEIGAQVLKEGGNAVDAIVAIQFALAVTEGMNTGVAASGFLTVYDSKSKQTKVIKGHSQAPTEATTDIFLDKNGKPIPFFERSTSAKAVGIPGIMKAMETALKCYGTIPLDRLIDPAVKLAERGSEVNLNYKVALDTVADRLEDEAKKVFMPDGSPLKEGEMIKQPDLAKTLKLIQKEGISALYEGELADIIIDTIQRHNGIMEKEDLQNYRATIDKPISISYKNFDLAMPAPPSAGGFSVAQLLKLLEPLNIGQYGLRSWQKYYLLTEAMRITDTDKIAYMADPAFVDIPMEGLLDSEYLKQRRNLIDFKHRNVEIDFGSPWEFQDGEPSHLIKQEKIETGNETTHFTAIDQWGNMAACTSSIEHTFGSGIMTPGYGFLLNNDLTDFSAEPGGVNEVKPGKFGVSTKCPMVVFHKGKPFLTIGSPGGTTIPASIIQVLLHLIEYKMDIKDAIEEPRVFTSESQMVGWEKGIPEGAKRQLKEMGYEWADSSHALGNVQAILIDSPAAKLYGGADSTRPGAAVGVKRT